MVDDESNIAGQAAAHSPSMTANAVNNNFDDAIDEGLRDAGFDTSSVRIAAAADSLQSANDDADPFSSTTTKKKNKKRREQQLSTSLTQPDNERWAGETEVVASHSDPTVREDGVLKVLAAKTRDFQSDQPHMESDQRPISSVQDPTVGFVVAGDRDMDIDEMDKAYSAYKKKDKRKKKRALFGAAMEELVTPTTVSPSGEMPATELASDLDADFAETSRALVPEESSTRSAHLDAMDAPSDPHAAIPGSTNLSSPTNKVQTLFPDLRRVNRQASSTSSPAEYAGSEAARPEQSASEGYLHTSEISQSLPRRVGRISPSMHSDETERNRDAPRTETHVIDSRAQMLPLAGAAALTLTAAAFMGPEPDNNKTQSSWRAEHIEKGEKSRDVLDCPQHQLNRDSAFQETDRELSSHQSEESGVGTAPEIRASQSRGSLRSRRSAEPLHISTQSDQDWTLPIPRARGAADHLEKGEVRTPLREMAETPLESTSRNRASYLFQSPPAHLKDLGDEESAATAKSVLSPDQNINRSLAEPPELSGLASPTPGSVGSRLPLHPIVEESTTGKRSKPDSDVGGPEHLKAIRRTETPRAIRSSHEGLLSPTAKAPLSTPMQAPRVPSDPLSTGGMIDRSPWPATDEQGGFTNVDRSLKRKSTQRISSDTRSPSVLSNRSNASVGYFRSPEEQRAFSRTSNRSLTPSLRRIDRSMSGDLRAASRRGDAGSGVGSTVGARSSPRTIPFEPPPTPPSNDEDVIIGGAARAAAMSDVFVSDDRTTDASRAYATQQGYGDAQRSQVSPTRPPSVRKRQSMHINDLESRLDDLAAENRALQNARQSVEQTHEASSSQYDASNNAMREALETRELQLRAKDAEISQIKALLQPMQDEIARLLEMNGGLAEANRNLVDDSNQRYTALQSEHSHAHEQWQSSSRELDNMRQEHGRLNDGMKQIVEAEIATALADKNTEIYRLREELDIASEQIRALQVQIQASKKSDFLTYRDEDYFDGSCQKLCQHVQQWVLRFSKLSDNRICRLSTELNNERLEARLDNAVLDGSDVDKLLGDRVRRRDVFMSLVMTTVWEHVFTRYLIGMDREQRQKLKTLEKVLAEVGPPRAVAQWRATTLTLLSKRPDFARQCALDTEAVAMEIFDMLRALLPPPKQAEQQLVTSLEKVIGVAADLSVEMRTQRAEYIMLPPLQPEYDTNGDLVRKVHFNASLMNERSGLFSSNQELESERAVVKIVLFPLVVKKGDEVGEGEEEIVVCPAQVLVHNDGGKGKKVVRVLSGAMEIDDARGSRASLVSTAGGSMAF